MIKAYLLVALITLLIFAGGIFLISRSTNTDDQIMSKIVYYQKTDTNKPSLQVVGDTHQDIGTMKVTEEKQAKFKITNVGSRPLQIYSGTTSCGCTFGQISTDVDQGPTFGMHDPRKFLVEVGPGQEAELTVTYKPSIMPVQGRNDRNVTIKTNDPDKPEQEFSITAYVD